jgi:hypothetical protein
MRSLRLHHLAALALAAAGLLLGAPSCSLIQSQNDCESSCDLLKSCGLLPASTTCGSYCTGFVAASLVSGCGDEFDAQNQCAIDNADCTSAALDCNAKVAAFASCIDAYCKKTPGAQGCP